MFGRHRYSHHGHSHRRRAPFGWTGRVFGPGEVRLALLSLLDESPRHGYELMRELEARSGGVYKASAGTVYPTLQQLEDEGLVRAGEVEERRVYKITAAGKREVEERADAIAAIWRRAADCGEWSHAHDPDAWEIARPASKVVKSAMRAMVHGADPDAVRRILDRAREDLDALRGGRR
jgi:DNA-binding PadR family transcriptional regulator